MKKENRKGFTLVELLAVIVLMAVLITVAVPGITRIGRSLKVQSFCSKIKIIESAALEYANDYYADKEINNTNSIDNVSLMDLVNMGYLKGDNDIKSTLTDAEKKDQANGKKFCVLYSKDSYCLVDPRDDSSMDYKLVKIWMANKRLYASFRYQSTDADNKICGDDITYQKETASAGATKNITYTLNDTINAKKPMENSSYGWSNYKSYRTYRTDEVPGDYYISKVTVNYEVGSKTILELKSVDFPTFGLPIKHTVCIIIPPYKKSIYHIISGLALQLFKIFFLTYFCPGNNYGRYFSISTTGSSGTI